MNGNGIPEIVNHSDQEFMARADDAERRAEPKPHPWLAKPPAPDWEAMAKRLTEIKASTDPREVQRLAWIEQEINLLSALAARPKGGTR